MTSDDLLATDMARLGARPYYKVGVPMFVIMQDMTTTGVRPATSANTGDLAERFAELSATLLATTPQPTGADVARLVEVLADRHLLGLNGPCFTRIADSPR